ncbi:MAG: protein jag [Pseudobdellovibrionaceae bacterium]
MSGFFSKLFGGGKKISGDAKVEELIRTTFDGLIDMGQFELEYELNWTAGKDDEPVLLIEFTGADEELLREKEGQLLDAFQLYAKRVLQHHLPEDRTNVEVDTNGYREESNQALIELAEKLKGIALEKGKPVYFRALPPKDRKVIHQYLADDARVKSVSIGDGLFKKIKITPTRGNQNAERQAE